MSDLDSALKDFHEDLDRIQELLGLVKRYRKFAAADPPEAIRDGSVTWEAAQALLDIAPQVRTDLPVLSGSLLLYVCGRFEYFVRELVSRIADNLAARAQTYADLPERVRDELQTRTLEVLQQPNKYGYLKLDAQHLITSLAENLTEATAVRNVVIESRVLSVTDANMNSRVLADLFKRVDYKDFWSEIGKQAPLKTLLGAKTDGACRADTTAKLDALMKERNGVAHPTTSTSFPDPDQVLETCGFLRVLSQVILDVAKVPR